MRPFDTLIRLAEQELDDKRLELARLEDILDQARAIRSGLDEELAEQQRIAAQDPSSAGTYGAYAVHMISRREDADAAIINAERDVEAQREVVRLAFAELKRYEITHEKRLAALKSEEDRKEQLEMDEIAQQLNRSKDRRF